jgi:crotonobetainyl-CoA:carnitine CoA-transferase CaiB-like acyl-CoA transferase
MANATGVDGLLAGIRVLDLSQYLPGPFAAQMLADMGADVVKVEPPAGDPMRRLGGVDGDGLAPGYKLVNAGKTVIRLDLKTVEDRNAFERMVAAADVLIESYRPGTLDKLGLPRSNLASLNPGLIHAALSGWGQDGPYRLRAGHDLNYMALGGGLASSGVIGMPVMAHPPVADHASAVQTVAAVSAALFRRERTGQGAYLDLNQMETVLGWQSWPLTLANRGATPRPAGDLLTGGAACYQIYRASDGRFVSLGAIEEKFWAAFCGTMGRPDWITRQFEPMPQDELIGEVAATIAAYPLSHWTDAFTDIDCCFEVVADLIEVVAHPHVVARGQVKVSGGSDPLVETLFGLRVDGAAPPERQPLVESDAGAVSRRWSV